MSDYWYPSSSRVSVIEREFADCNRRINKSEFGADDQFVPLVLKAIFHSTNVAGFPGGQIGRWIEVVLQFAFCKSADTEFLDKTRGILTFLTLQLGKESLTQSEIKDINWALDSASNLMAKYAGAFAQTQREEISKLWAQIDSCEESEHFDAAKIRRSLSSRIEEFKSLAAAPGFDAIPEKVDAVFKTADIDAPEGSIARSTLLTLARRSDEYSEFDRALTVLRDANVIETAYAAISGQTHHLPILKCFLQSWPFISTLPSIGRDFQTPNRFTQYIAGSCLHSLFHKEVSLLVVRNNSVHCMIVAIMAAIETMKRETVFTEIGVSTWKYGQAITISDGTRTFKADFLDTQFLGGKRKLRIRVRDRASITIDDSILPFVATVLEPHSRLSSGNDIQEWLKQRHPDPMLFLTGSSRRRLVKQACILLVCPKNKFEAYLDGLRPLNSSIAALFGLTYVTSHSQLENRNGTAVETSRIFVCSDVDVATDLITEPPEHVGSWRVIVDGARAGSSLLAAIPKLNESNASAVCVVAELHERESCTEIAARNVTPLYLEDTHVEVPRSNFRLLSAQQDPVHRTLNNQRNYACTSRQFHPVRNLFLEELALILKARNNAVASGQAEATILDLRLSEYLRRSISCPIKIESAEQKLKMLEEGILAQASVDRQYDSEAEKIYKLFSRRNSTDVGMFHRETELRSIAIRSETDESVAILCRSQGVADECYHALPPGSILRKFNWVGLQALRRSAPYDRIIVPGWLPRLAIRELINNGYAGHLNFIFLPFENDWYLSLNRANRAFEEALQSRSRKVLSDLATEFGLPASKVPFSPEAGIDTVSGVAAADESDAADFERIEAKAIDLLLRSSVQTKVGQATAKAQLVVFEEVGSYAYLPPGGKVIVVPGKSAALDEDKLAAGLAEQLLFRSVSALAPGMVIALPVETDRDLVDDRADQFLPNSGQIRYAAGLWKSAIKRHIGSDPKGHIRFAQRLSDAGQSREASTVKLWISQTATVAPSNYRYLIPLIAKLTDDAELNARCVEVLQSVDQIYRAKASAAEAIVRELFAQEIDADQEELSFNIDGHTLKYQIRHVMTLAGIREVPVDLIGKASFVTGSAQSSADLNGLAGVSLRAPPQSSYRDPDLIETSTNLSGSLDAADTESSNGACTGDARESARASAENDTMDSATAENVRALHDDAYPIVGYRHLPFAVPESAVPLDAADCARTPDQAPDESAYAATFDPSSNPPEQELAYKIILPPDIIERAEVPDVLDGTGHDDVERKNGRHLARSINVADGAAKSWSIDRLAPYEEDVSYVPAWRAALENAFIGVTDYATSPRGSGAAAVVALNTVEQFGPLNSTAFENPTLTPSQRILAGIPIWP